MSNKQTASIKVFSPIPDGKRWWQAQLDGSATLIAEYMCDPIEEYHPDTPHPDSVREVAKLHPGCDLVYLD